MVNLSWGSVRSITSIDRALQLAINAAMSLDIVTVAAAGNGDENDNPLTGTHYPSDLPEVVAVTALDCNGSSTPYGTKPTSWCDYNSNKDLIAPGNYVYTTTNTSNSSYAATAGTSISSPLVAGVFALVWAANSALTVEQAKNCVYSTVYTNFTVTSGREGKYGKGIPNALGAVNAAKNIAYDTSNDTVVNMGTEEYRIAPVYNTAKYSTSQTIYTASEIGRSGIITNLAYYVSTVGSSSTGSLKIYLGHTSKTTYGSDATLIPVSQQTLVYSNDNRKVGASYGWESMQLGSTFKYNGTSNLVVTVVRSATSYGSSYTYYGGIEKSTNPSIYRCSNTDSSYASPSNNQVDYYTSFSPALKLTFSTANGLKSIAKPSATTSFTYDGSAKTAVAAGTGYTLSGTYSATVPGTYTCTVTPKTGYVWSDGTSSAMEVTWKIDRKVIEIPESVTLNYNGKMQTFLTSNTYYTVTRTSRACSVGTYIARVSLTNVSYYVWSDGTTDKKSIAWFISTGPDFESSAWAKDVGGTANSSYLPFSPNTTNYYTNQFIYTADEIGSAGTIGNISFKVSSNGSFAKDYVRVYMGNTTKSKFNSSSDQLTFNEVTLVYAYSNSSQPWGGNAIKDNYITINLDTAFDYDGVSNLGIIFVVGGGYIDKNVTFAASAQPGMSMYRGSTENPVTTSVSTNYTIHGVRPHIRLGMTLADCSNKYTGSGVNALTIYTAKPSVGCMYYNGAAMVYDMSKGAWVLPSTKAIDFNPSLVTTSTSATATVLTKRGDVNRNGKVNIVDSQVAYDIARNKIKFSSSTTANYVAADANRDNYVDAADALAIQSYVLRGKW